MGDRGKVVVFGAGATGRGHVGLLCWQAGYQLVLVDQNQDLVNRLRQEKSYTVQLFGGNNTANRPVEVVVDGYKAYHAIERIAIAREIEEADLVLTAVFDQNLPDVATTIAGAVTFCNTAGRSSPINVIACENMMNSSSTLGSYVQENLNQDDRDYCQKVFGFPDSMISRVVPRPGENSLNLITEDYNEWTVRADALNGSLPSGMDFIEPVDNQSARLERKFFIHNGGHAVTGYVGFHRGCRYIHEAVQDPIVATAALGALDQLGEIVRRKHGFSQQSIQAYKDSFIRRGSIESLRDDVLRVIRDPIRKLSSKERLVAPAILAVDYRLHKNWIIYGIVAALRYSHPMDKQSLILEKKLAEDGLAKTVEEICGIDNNSSLMDEIIDAYTRWVI